MSSTHQRVPASIRQGLRVFAAFVELRSIGLLLGLMAVLAAAANVFAQAGPQRTWSQQAWSTEEGLPAAGVSQVLQSRDGYLWLATEGGAVRFDGSSFKVLRHGTQPVFTSDDVSVIAEDTSGALWFGTADGLIRARDNSLQRYAEQDGLPSATVLSLAATDDGKVLVLTSDGVALFDGTKFHLLPEAPLSVIALSRNKDGSVMLMTQNGGLRYDRGTLHPMPVPGGTGQVLGVQTRVDGATWVWSAHAVSYSAGSVQHKWQTGRDFPEGRVTALTLDHSGVAWIGTNHGLFLLEGPKNTLRPAEQLRNEAVLSITEDREGNLWIGTQSSGLHALRPRKFRNEAAAAGEAVTSVATAPDGTAWFGTRADGVRHVRNGAAAFPVAASALTSPVVLSLAPGNHGDVWVGTPDGLNHIQGKAVEQFTSATGLPDDFVRSVLVDEQGVVWAGTRRGLARLQGGDATTFTRANGLGADSIGPLLAPRRPASASELWLGTAAGLSHMTGGRIESFAPGNGGERDIVTALAEDPAGRIWVALHNAGLSRFEAGRFLKVAASGFPSEIKALAFDRGGNLWLRGVAAVYRVPQAALDDCLAHSDHCDFVSGVYDALDGMPSDALTAEGVPLIGQASGGELWFATRKGLAVTDPATLPLNRIPPPVAIQRFAVDDAEQSIGPDELRIAPGNSRYTFEFVALSYTLPAKNRYRYTLEGFDRGWMDASATRTASYTSLPPGHYRFRVQACNNDGVWNETGAELRFRVLPPLYRRWWFFLLVLAAVGALAYGIYLLRVHAIERRFALVLNERNRMAREVHDTLAQDLVSVSLQLDIATGCLKQGNAEAATVQIGAARTLVKEGLDAARQSIWNLRAAAGEDSLPVRLTNLVRVGNRKPVPALKMGGAFRKLLPAIEDEVFRIAQESLINIQRHAAATEARVELQYESDKLLLQVQDNGRGFSRADAARLQGHYGLRGMGERAAALGAELIVASEPGEGTTVTLLVPLPRTERT